MQIIDARTPAEFAGEDIRAIRGGHIPGAVNIPYEQNWVDPNTPAKLARKEVSSNAGMSLKRTADLKQLYSRFDPHKETIVYCQSGARASDLQPLPKSWETPDSDEKIVDILRDEFRIRFADSWATKIGSAQALYARQMTSLDLAKPVEGADYCIWLAGTAAANRLLSVNDDSVQQSVTVRDRDAQSSTLIAFDFATPAGVLDAAQQPGARADVPALPVIVGQRPES